MPTYEYHCSANDRTVEVRHAMAEILTNWGALCERAGLDPGPTPAAAPVVKLISASAVLCGAGASNGSLPASCDMGQACCGGGCGQPAN
ncbi:MAG: hypothetical protein R3E77_08790 [Steroidobacteraceae bacterium]